MDATKNEITQPRPQITGVKPQKRYNSQPQRKVNRPYVSVVQVPYISNTPLADTISLKEKENPHIKYKITINKKHSDIKASSIISLSIIGCGLAAFLKAFKK